MRQNKSNKIKRDQIKSNLVTFSTPSASGVMDSSTAMPSVRGGITTDRGVATNSTPRIVQRICMCVVIWKCKCTYESIINNTMSH